MRQKNKIEIEKYLKEIDFDGRLEKGKYFFNKEFRNLLVENLEKYFVGKRNQDFILELGAVLYPEVMTSTDKHDDSLMNSVCLLQDLASNYKNTPKTKKGKDKVLLSILKLLKKTKERCPAS